MPGKQAKILSDQHIEDFTGQPVRNRAVVLFSMKQACGLARLPI
jgi:hypothetical protein